MNQFLIFLYYYTFLGYVINDIRKYTSHLLMVSEPNNPFKPGSKVSHLILFNNPVLGGKKVKSSISHYLDDLWDTIVKGFFEYDHVVYDLSKVDVPEMVKELLYISIPLTEFRYMSVGTLYVGFKLENDISKYLNAHYNNYRYKIYQKDNFIYVFKVFRESCTLIQVYYIHGESIAPLVMSRLRTIPLYIIIPTDTQYDIVILTQAYCGTNFSIKNNGEGYLDYLADLDDKTLVNTVMVYVMENELLPTNYVQDSFRIEYNKRSKKNEILCDVSTDNPLITNNYLFDLNLNEILNATSRLIRANNPIR
jgi:hypothetical protein